MAWTNPKHNTSFRGFHTFQKFNYNNKIDISYKRCFAQCGTICNNLKNVKNIDGGVLLLVKLQA